MAIMEAMEDAKRHLEEIKKNHRFKKANLAREEMAELTASLAKCSGKLEICRKDFNRTIRTQSRNISDGLRQGADTMVQEQMLWDAAMGYLLVRDAMFALRTINSYDSVAHAYDLLDAATKQITGKRSSLAKFVHIKSGKTRNEYGYITSATAVKEKETLLESFFDRLKVNGDIEECLSLARNPGDKQAERRRACIDGVAPETKAGGAGGSVSSRDALMDRLNGVQSTQEPEDFSNVDFSAMGDIHPPKE